MPEITDIEVVDAIILSIQTHPDMWSYDGARLTFDARNMLQKLLDSAKNTLRIYVGSKRNTFEDIEVNGGRDHQLDSQEEINRAATFVRENYSSVWKTELLQLLKVA